MNFSTPQRVQDTILYLDEIEMIRGENRAKLNNLYNGFPPLSEAEAKKWGLRLNIDWKEAAMMAQRARQQYNNAFLKPNHFFMVDVQNAPVAKQAEWSHSITKKINKVMKRSQPYRSTVQETFAEVVLHGLGIRHWGTGHNWLADFVPIENFRVPTDTNLDLSNCSWFAIYREYTPGELVEKIENDVIDPGWNREAILKILANIEDDNFRKDLGDYNITQFPEKFVERIKQDLGYYMSDAVPVVPFWEFYFEDTQKNGKGWYRRAVCDRKTPGGDPEVWLYDSKRRKVADELSQIIHIQHGDLNNKPPFKWHSVRSLGFLMADPCFWQNVTRCQLVQHTLEQFNIWLRVADPQDRSRAQFFQSGNCCVVPDGVTIVPKDQRHSVDAGLVQLAMQQMRQLMGEASESYTQEFDDPTGQRQTAYEIAVRANLTNALLTSLLTSAYEMEKFHYREICRRFCRKTTLNADCRQFQEECKEEGIPMKCLDVEHWEIEPEMTIGQGNRALQLANVQQLMQQINMFGPEGQDVIKHDYVSVLMDDPRKAERIAPLENQNRITNSVHDAELAFGTLMEGVPVRPQEGMNPIEQVETMLPLFGQRLEQIKVTGLPSPQDLIGFNNVGAYITALLERIGQDPRERQRVKQYGDALGQMMNVVKKLTQQSFQQRAAQQQNGNGGPDPEAMQKLQQNQMLFQQKTEQKTLSHAQKTQERRISFAEKQKMDMVAHQLQLEQEAQSAALEGAKENIAQARKFAFEAAKERATEGSQ